MIVGNDGKKYADVPGIHWFTNIPNSQKLPFIPLMKSYTPEEYPTFDNYPAINVDKTLDIPADYDGLMGVPLSFIDKYNPEQFEIVDCIKRYAVLDTMRTNEFVREKKSHSTYINRRCQIC